MTTTTPTPRLSPAVLLLAIAAATLLTIGLAIGLTPTSSLGYSCGAAFDPSTSAGNIFLSSGDCAAVLSTRRLTAAVVIIAAVGSGLGAAMLRWTGWRSALVASR